MKTALKDLIEKLQKFRLIKEDENSYELFRQLELESLQKEKEQIIKSWGKGYSTGCVVGSNDYTNEDEEKDNGNYYYNQTYNQNK